MQAKTNKQKNLIDNILDERPEVKNIKRRCKKQFLENENKCEEVKSLKHDGDDVCTLGDSCGEVSGVLDDTRGEVSEALGSSCGEVFEALGDGCGEVSEALGDSCGEVSEALGDSYGDEVESFKCENGNTKTETLLNKKIQKRKIQKNKAQNEVLQNVDIEAGRVLPSERRTRGRKKSEIKTNESFEAKNRAGDEKLNKFFTKEVESDGLKSSLEGGALEDGMVCVDMMGEFAGGDGYNSESFLDEIKKSLYKRAIGGEIMEETADYELKNGVEYIFCKKQNAIFTPFGVIYGFNGDNARFRFRNNASIEKLKRQSKPCSVGCGESGSGESKTLCKVGFCEQIEENDSCCDFGKEDVWLNKNQQLKVEKNFANTQDGTSVRDARGLQDSAEVQNVGTVPNVMDTQDTEVTKGVANIQLVNENNTKVVFGGGGSNSKNINKKHSVCKKECGEGLVGSGKDKDAGGRKNGYSEGLETRQHDNHVGGDGIKSNVNFYKLNENDWHLQNLGQVGGFWCEKVSAEFETGKMVCVKKKVAKKFSPPDTQAMKMLIELNDSGRANTLGLASELDQLNNMQLEKMKNDLIKRILE